MSVLEELRARVSEFLARADQNGPIAATAKFRVRRDRETEFRRLALEFTSATRRMQGVRKVGLHRHRSANPAECGPIEYLIYEDWRSVAAFIPQWNSSHLARFQMATREMMSEPPVLTLYDGSPVASAVLRTGQKKCWDSKGTEIAAAGTGQDGDKRKGATVDSPRFTDNGNGSVTDNLTGLVWLKNANLFGDVSWSEAMKNAAGLSAGKSGLADGSEPGDWRMPNLNELQSLLDLSRDHGPSIPVDNPFINLQCANYWTSSSVAIAPALGWYTALAVGPPVFDLKGNIMRMWPVRGSGNGAVPQTGAKQCFDDQWGAPVDCAGTRQDAALAMGAPLPSPRFKDNEDGTVTDNLTRLVWLKDANRFGTLPWADALMKCNALSSEGPQPPGAIKLSDGSHAGDWRLPNFNELRSIVDYSCAAPAIASDHPFRNVRPSLYWCSTTVPSAPNLARFVFVGVGPGVWDHKSVRMNVWPVRNGSEAE